MKKPADLEMSADTHSPFCPIWRIFQPMYQLPSKMAGFMNSFFAILGRVVLQKTIFQGISLGY